jgi:phospholipase/carboxylesterase
VTIEHRARPAAGEPEGLLVLFHGRGADEHDLFPLLDLLDPNAGCWASRRVGRSQLPPGGAHWYAVREIGYPDPGTFLPTYAAVTDWLDGMWEEAGLGPERTVLGGFSQGAVMTYALGLGRGRPRPAALVALSGFVPTVEGFELDLERAAAADRDRTWHLRPGNRASSGAGARISSSRRRAPRCSTASTRSRTRSTRAF